MMSMLNTHFSHAKDIVAEDLVVTDRTAPINQYRDLVGNLSSRIVIPDTCDISFLTCASPHAAEPTLQH
jgi:hypothetical protein